MGKKYSSKGQARLSLKQCMQNSNYLFYTFLILSHYCYSYPHLTSTIWNKRRFYSILFYTRSLPCFTELYKDFYSSGVKCVPKDIYNMITIQGFAH